MEINTAYPKQTNLSVSDWKIAVADELEQSKKLSPLKSIIEKPESDNSDKISLSAEALSLAQPVSQRTVASAAPIDNREQAQQVLGRLVSDIQANPRQAQNIYSTRLGGGVGSLLS